MTYINKKRVTLLCATIGLLATSCVEDPRAMHTDERQYTFVGVSNGRNVEITVEAELAARSAIPLSNFNQIIDNNQTKFADNLGKRLATLPAEINEETIKTELENRSDALDKQLQRDTLNRLRIEEIDLIAFNIYADSAQENFTAFLSSPVNNSPLTLTGLAGA